MNKYNTIQSPFVTKRTGRNRIKPSAYRLERFNARTCLYASLSL